jgi:hypothetical protein
MALVLLVNNNSASATEIVTGAVQDDDGGVIVGVTFGGIFFSTENSVGGFTRHYLGTRVLSLTKDFGVDDRVMKEFEQFLSAHDVHCTQADWDRKIGFC